MPPGMVYLNSVRYEVAHQSLVPAGAKQWSVTARPSQLGDPSIPQEMDWYVDTCHLNSFEDTSNGGQGFLGVDYTVNVDTRWKGVATLGPLINTIDCSAVGGTTANSNCQDESGGMNASVYAYIGRGTIPAKVKLSDMSVTAGPTMPEAVTSILYSKTQSGTEGISFGMAGSAYRTITTVATPASADTVSTTNTEICRILGTAPDRIVGLESGGVIKGNILSGSTTMASPNWVTVATVQAQGITFTGFAMDANFWIVGTDRGPYMLDASIAKFFPLIAEADSDASNNCRQMQPWTYLGVIIPLADGTRYMHFGEGKSIGPERFLMNTSPVQGRTTGVAGRTKWLYTIIYNPSTTDSYLTAWRPRQPGDPHANDLSPYVIAKFASKASNYLKNIGTLGGRTSPTLMGGYGTDAFWMTIGTTTREIDDSNYRYASSGTLYLTESRRQPALIKDVRSIEFETSHCTANQTITVSINIDGTTTTLSGTLGYNGAVTSNGFHRLLMVNDSSAWLSAMSGRRIKPQIAFATNTSSDAPRIEGILKVSYQARPVLAKDYAFSLVLDEKNPKKTAEELKNQLLTEWGAGPVTMQEDDDGRSYTVRVTDVAVTQAKDTGTSPDRPAVGKVWIAQVKATKFPTASGD